MINVPEYRIELTDGSIKVSTGRMSTTLEICTPKGKAHFEQIEGPIMDGPLSPISVGIRQLKQLAIKPMWPYVA